MARAFNLLLLAAFAVLVGCGKVYNSLFSDFVCYGSGVFGSANFIVAWVVMSG